MEKLKITPIKKKIAEPEPTIEPPPPAKISVMKKILPSEIKNIQKGSLRSLPEAMDAVPIVDTVPVQNIAAQTSEVQNAAQTSEVQNAAQTSEVQNAAQTSEVQNKVPHVDASVKDPDPTDSVEDESETSEAMDIHPKLQEILQYLADDDHVTIVKKSYLDLMEKRLQQCLDGIESLLMLKSQNPSFEQDTISYLARIDEQMSVVAAQAPITVTLNGLISNNIGSSESDTDSPTNSPTEHNMENNDVPAPKSDTDNTEEIAMPNSDRPKQVTQTLVDLINRYNEDTYHELCQSFNDTFEATFIFNYAGRAERCAKYLTDLGIHNCIVIDTPIPKGYDTNRKANCYLREILAISRKMNYKVINVIADFLCINKTFFDTLSYIFNDIQSGSWDILQYCSSDHTHQPNYDVNWDYYIKCNPDLKQLGISTEQRALQHYRDKGSRQGRVGICELVGTSSNNILAFAMKYTVFNKLQENLDKAEHSKGELPLFDFHKTSLMTVPNLFIIPNTPAANRVSLRWHAGSYETM